MTQPGDQPLPPAPHSGSQYMRTGVQWWLCAAGEGRRLSKTRDQAALDPVFAFISAPPVFTEDGRDRLHGSGGRRYTASLHPLHSPATGQTVTKAILVPLRWRHPEVEGPERDKGFFQSLVTS